MRRWVGYGVLTFGLFLIAEAPFLLFYATPRIEKAPTDTYDTIVARGPGSYFSAKTLSLVGPTTLENVQIYKGDPRASSSTVAVVRRFSRTTDPSASNDIDYAESIIPFDRKSGVGVRCCGADPAPTGITLKFPFATKQITYFFWDPTPAMAFPARYVRTEDVDGLRTYVFESVARDFRMGTMEIPGFLAGQPAAPNVTVDKHYATDTTVWVEPITGAIVKGDQKIRQWVTDAAGATVTDLVQVDFTYTRQTVAHERDLAASAVSQLKVITTFLPLFGPIIGVALIVLGIVLLRERSKPDRGSAASPPAG